MRSHGSELSSWVTFAELQKTAWKAQAMDLKAVYRWRGCLAALPVIFSIFCFVGECERASIVWPLGVLFFVGGWALRVWAQKHLGYRLKINKTVTTSGPYSLVRNPIYIANTLVILGTIALSEVLWMLPITLLWCAVLYSLVVHYEEQRLAAKYGNEYLDYLTAAPRWLPRLASPQGNAHFQCSLSQMLRAELHVVLIIAVPLVKEFIVAPFLE
jgi:protein-S-isoprenylcysteine O-methyltransferase Ste14